MGKCFSHLTLEDRQLIERELNKKTSIKEIARLLGKHINCIYYELKRANAFYTKLTSSLTEVVAYSPEKAYEDYMYKLKAKGSDLKIGKDIELANYIEEQILENKMSPQAVLYKIKNLNLSFSVVISSVNTIYSYIRKGIFNSLSMEDCPMPRRKKKKQKIYRNKEVKRGVSIDERGFDLKDRSEFGHWELDCVVGKIGTKNALLVFTERKTRYEIIEYLPQKNTENVVKAIDRLEKEFGESFYKIFKSITTDNGFEFYNFEGIKKAKYKVGWRCKHYFCHSHCSFERGSNENQNKFIRRFFKKGTVIPYLSREEVKEIQDYMNDYGRKIFEGKTSRMKFEEELAKILY